MTASRIVFPPLSYVGWGALTQLVPEVKRLGGTHVLVITDPALEKLGLVEQVASPLRQAGCSVHVYTDVVPEPPLETGEKAVAFARGGEFDLVIGVGGSAMDLAKLAAVLAVHKGSVADYLNLTGTRTLEKKGLPKILIPTTSGTGSEVTNISVLSLDTTKDVVTHDYLLADVAIVDPQLTVSVPPRVTAATGIDALTHAVEAYVSVNASPTSDGLALQAMRLIAQGGGTWSGPTGAHRYGERQLPGWVGVFQRRRGGRACACVSARRTVSYRPWRIKCCALAVCDGLHSPKLHETNG